MEIIKNRTIVEDTWHVLDGETALPQDGTDIIVPLERWNSDDRAQLKVYNGQVGVQIGPTDDVRVLEDLDALALIAVTFPKFADGRGYSQAYILRYQLGFKGTLRAVGDVLRDQLYHMGRCGIDEFAMAEGKSLQEALAAFSVYSISYQETHGPVG